MAAFGQLRPGKRPARFGIATGGRSVRGDFVTSAPCSSHQFGSDLYAIQQHHPDWRGWKL